MKSSILCILLIIPFFSFAQSEKLPIYKDSTQPVESRVMDLLGRMTLQEKLAQMQDISFSDISSAGITDSLKMRKVLNGISYGCYEGMNLSVRQYARAIGVLQKYLVNNSRLGIPMLTTSEALHGCVHSGATIFPQAIALGSTFNPKLVNEMTHAITKELKVQGILCWREEACRSC